MPPPNYVSLNLITRVVAEASLLGYWWSDKGQTEKNSLRANVFRVTPESGHCSMQSAVLKGAKRRHAPNYSITSLASASKFRGISRSSAFAVLRLITRSITLYLRDKSCLLNSARLVSLF